VRRSITAQFTVTLALVSAVVLPGFAVMIVAARSLRSADAARSRSTNALTTANQLEQSVLDLETGLRGYLLAGRPLFLEPYQEALRRYAALVRDLESDTAGDPTTHRYSASIRAAIRAYVTKWAEPVIALAQRDLAAARRAEAGGAGKARVGALRTQFAALLARETTLHLEQVEQSSSLASIVLVAGIVGGVAFALLIAYVAIRAQRRLVAPVRRLAGAAAAIAEGDLSVRVAKGGTAEVGELVSGFNRMAQSLDQQRTELQDHQGELEAQKTELEDALASLEERSARIERLSRFGDRLAAQHSVESVTSATLESIADASARATSVRRICSTPTLSYSRLSPAGDCSPAIPRSACARARGSRGAPWPSAGLSAFLMPRPRCGRQGSFRVAPPYTSCTCRSCTGNGRLGCSAWVGCTTSRSPTRTWC
jgi:CHASE3 domain sensor protein